MPQSTAYGYDVDEIDAPKYLSHGEWTITGTKSIDAWMPLKPNVTLASGLFGSSGLYAVDQYAEPYDNQSGLSGCIGVNIRKIHTQTNTGLRNANLGLRKMAVLHEGYCMMSYESGTLDGTVITLKYGDAIAPTISGFRAYEELNTSTFYAFSAAPTLETGAAVPTATGVFISGISATAAYTALNTGYRQCKLGWFADVASNMTGYWHRVKIMPNSIYGTTK